MLGTDSTAPGSLEVICGPMFSGKSEELIRRLRRAHIAQQTVVTFKHNFDDRHNLHSVVSHNGTELTALAISEPHSILKHALTASANVVGIDEVQFFDNDIITVICTLINNGKRVIIAGLDLDFRGVPFSCMPTLLAIADNVTKLQSICTICYKDAYVSQRLVDEKPARYDDPVVLPGAQEKYQARCRSCHEIDKQPTL